MKIGILHTGEAGDDLRNLMAGAFAQIAGVVVRGALDDLGPDGVRGLAPSDGAPPIVTQLADGRPVIVGHEALESLLQQGIDRLTGDGVGLIVLLCTGEFPSLASAVPLIQPSRLLRRLVGDIVPPGGRLGVLVPIPEQVAEAERRWAALGCAVAAVPASPFGDGCEMDAAAGWVAELEPSLLVLDCFAYAREHRERIRRRFDGLLVLPQEIVVATVLQLLL